MGRHLRPAPLLVGPPAAAAAAAAAHVRSSSKHQNDLFASTSLTVPSLSSLTGNLLSINPVPPLRLAAKEEPTRVQLQRQRLQEYHASIVVSQRIPGLKTSTAFFASLRTNLRLNASPPPSPISTPPSMRASTNSLPPPSPLAYPADFAPMDSSSTSSTTHPLAATAAVPPPIVDHDPLAGVPELTSYIATSEDDRLAALRLTADSVAQMRQAANEALIFHPLNLSAAVGVVAVLARAAFVYSHRDPVAAFTTCGGLIMALLLLCRWLTQGHLAAAERIDLAWLGDRADVFVTRFGDEVIGAAIVDWLPLDGSGGGGGGGASTSSTKRKTRAVRGEIKAWTVRLKYRRKGVGAALLDEVVKESRKRGADSVVFADRHANSTRVLPDFYNARFDRAETKARDALHDLLQASPTKYRRRRGGSS